MFPQSHLFVLSCYLRRLRLVQKPPATEPNPSKPINGSGDAVCGRRLVPVSWGVAVFCSLVDGVLVAVEPAAGLAVWSGVVVVVLGLLFWLFMVPAEEGAVVPVSLGAVVVVDGLVVVVGV